MAPLLNMTSFPNFLSILIQIGLPYKASISYTTMRVNEGKNSQTFWFNFCALGGISCRGLENQRALSSSEKYLCPQAGVGGAGRGGKNEKTMPFMAKFLVDYAVQGMDCTPPTMVPKGVKFKVCQQSGTTGDGLQAKCKDFSSLRSHTFSRGHVNSECHIDNAIPS